MAFRLSTHKYRAKPVTIDGIRFASTREGERYGELTMLHRARQISSLELQPEWSLHAGPSHRTIGWYRADFSYVDAQSARVVEDVKGFDTPLSKWKRKHLQAEYGIDVRIIR